MKASKLLKPTILAVLTLALVWAIAPQAYAQLNSYYVPNYGTPYDPLNIPVITSSGGTIEAEFFNKDYVTARRPVIDTGNPGNNWTGYYAITPGNQGNWNGRSDNATIDIDVYSGGGSTGYYIQCANEWVNYRFNVTVAGWYTVQFNAMVVADGEIDYIAIDDVIYDGTWLTYYYWLFDGPVVHLTEGDHNIKVYMASSSGVCLDYIQFSPASAPDLPDALPTQITDLQFTYPDTVVADAVVTATEFNGGAIPNDDIDDTQAIQEAIDAVSNNGGGTVFIPRGTYRIDGTLTLPSLVTLRGEWARPINPATGASDVGNGAGTILKAMYNGVPTSTSFITAYGGHVKYLSIWYPNQTNPASPIPYGWTLDCPVGTCLQVSNVTLYNSYKGIYQSNEMRDVYMTALNQGIRRWGAG